MVMIFPQDFSTSCGKLFPRAGVENRRKTPSRFSLPKVFRNVDRAQIGVLDAPLRALKILHVVAQKHENVVVWRAPLGLGYVQKAAQEILRDPQVQLGLIFHNSGPFFFCETMQGFVETF